MSRIKQVHDGGDSNAAWKIGEAFLKVQRQSTYKKTCEHETLGFLRKPANGFPFTCSIPRVLYHNEFNEYYYLVMSQIQGETLERVWPDTSETAKQSCVVQVVDICKALARKENKNIYEIDGGKLVESWISLFTTEYSYQALLMHCRELGMTKDAFILYPCDLGPTNIVKHRGNNHKVGIIDWEMTVFVPKK